ncbi:cytochrome c biogenesis protein, partial [Candidatus Pyrohabitans sp.]
MRLRYLALLILILSSLPLSFAAEHREAVIYYNEACTDCTIYIKERLVPLLKEEGIVEVVLKDYVNNPEYRKELVSLNQREGIPPRLQGHLSAVVDGRIFLEGHVPEHAVREALTWQGKLVVYQDSMSADAKSYRVWVPGGEIREYPIDEPLSTYFNELKDMKPGRLEGMYSSSGMLPLVIVTGLLDGINPCAFAVLLFFIAFLFTIKKTRAGVLKMGAVYISAIYLAYFLIGIGIMKALMFTGKPHFMAKLGAYLIIILGLINIKDYINPFAFPVHLRIPSFSHATLRRWAYRGTFPSAAVLGFLVGLCTFPCSGGIYVAILALLSAKTTYLQGLAYLMLYNLMFVVPLIVILALASNEKVTKRL